MPEGGRRPAPKDIIYIDTEEEDGTTPPGTGGSKPPAKRQCVQPPCTPSASAATKPCFTMAGGCGGSGKGGGVEAAQVEVRTVGTAGCSLQPLTIHVGHLLALC